LKNIALFRLLIASVFFTNMSSVHGQNIVIEVLDPQSVGVGDVVVYLTPLETNISLPKNTTPLIITQKNKKFAPYLAVTQQGSALSFNNQDDFTHHIYSVAGKNRFEFKIKAGKDKTSPILNHAGEIAMGCNIHDWMSGYVLVVDTPYYGKTNQQGKATFDLSSAGKYKVVVWHPQLELKNYRFEKLFEVNSTTQSNPPLAWKIKLPKTLLPVPEQENQDEFEFLEGY